MKDYIGRTLNMRVAANGDLYAMGSRVVMFGVDESMMFDVDDLHGLQPGDIVTIEGNRNKCAVVRYRPMRFTFGLWHTRSVIREIGAHNG